MKASTLTQLASLLAVSTLSLVAKADIIKCTFTEPFINTTYSMTQSTLTIQEMDQPAKVIKNVSFQIKGPGNFELWDKNRNVLQSLQLTYNGSDGMSDRVFPYEVVQKGLHGGCVSNFLHAE